MWNWAVCSPCSCAATGSLHSPRAPSGAPFFITKAILCPCNLLVFVIGYFWPLDLRLLRSVPFVSCLLFGPSPAASCLSTGGATLGQRGLCPPPPQLCHIFQRILLFYRLLAHIWWHPCSTTKRTCNSPWPYAFSHSHLITFLHYQWQAFSIEEKCMHIAHNT